MKNYILKISTGILSIVFMSCLMFSCKNEDFGSIQMHVTGVYLQDVDSDVPDRLVEFARLGQILRIEGSGFTGLKYVYINGYECYFNTALLSDKSFIVSVNKNVPTVGLDESVKNTIRLVKDGTELVYSFNIYGASATITSISNCMPNPGEPIIVYGEGLHEINKVTFPGNIVVSEGIVSDPDGEYFQVTVPEGISQEGGSIFAEGANGGVYSPSYFNYKKGLILDFDGHGVQGSWGDKSKPSDWNDETNGNYVPEENFTDEELAERRGNQSMIFGDEILNEKIGEGNTSQGNYCSLLLDRHLPVSANKNRISEIWTGGAGVDPDWSTLGIPVETPIDECGIQFELYVPNDWKNTGFLKICLINNFNGGEWEKESYNYVPWIVDGKIVAFKTSGWQTVTIPFSEFYCAKSLTSTWATLQDVIASRNGATYPNFGFYFENSTFTLSKLTGKEQEPDTEFTSNDIQSSENLKIYIDNWRIVPIQTPAYSDFGEETDSDTEE